MSVSQIVLASGNKGKLKEFNAMFADASIKVRPQHEFNVIEAEETGLTFVENAIIKARNASAQTGLSAIADDSGLEVEALKGEPGIYSARYSSDTAGGQANDQTNNDKLLRALNGITGAERSARFVCALVYIRHAKDPTPVVCIGTWSGRICEIPSGDNGFGYDPLFYLEEYGCTSAELESDKKNRVSHRGQAMQLLQMELQKQGVI